MPQRFTHWWYRRCVLGSCIFTTVLVGGCTGPVEIGDPLVTLNTAEQSPRAYQTAIDEIAMQPDPLGEEELRTLRGVIHRPGYTVDTRERALEVLAERDLVALKETIGFRLPQLSALQWRRRLCEIIADRGWDDLTPALVRALAVPIAGWVPDVSERPEYLAIARLHGQTGVTDVIFDTFMESNSVALQGLRRSAWTLLIKLGERDRLAQLLESSDVPADDLMLRDLQVAARELGVIPVNHEEIIWLRTLRQPAWADFWADARDVVANLSPQQRHEFELRDLAILIAAAEHEPDLLSRTKGELYAQVEDRLRGTRHHYKGSTHDGFGGSGRERLADHRDLLTWGDLAAMRIALRAMEVPQVVAHLFDYAERDRMDESTEYGGVVRLDELNRIEVVEFVPRMRFGDYKFEASQDMFDAGYGAIFHFHFHCQRYNNSAFAGPGPGDAAYAENARANCLVLTFVNDETMNIDFYRHGGVVVDLGEIRR